MSDYISLPMACCCKPDANDALNALVGERTASQMIMSLYWEHSYVIEWIGVDMWMGMKIKSAFQDEEEVAEQIRNLPSIRIEFDVLEHGLAKLIEHITMAGSAEAR